MKLQRLVEGVGVDEVVETVLMLHMSWTLKNSHLGRCPQVWRRREVMQKQQQLVAVSSVLRELTKRWGVVRRGD